MKFDSSEISFILNEKNKTLASQLYDNTDNGKQGIHHIEEQTKMVIFYCNNPTRQRIYNIADKLNIKDDIIQIQPYAVEDKPTQYQILLDEDINVPEFKMFLQPVDTISDWIVKPPNGFYGRGIDYAHEPKTYNRFYQKLINKSKEYRIVQCSWFDDISQCRVIEKTVSNKSDLTQNYSNGRRNNTFANIWDKNTKDIEQDIVDELIRCAKIIIEKLQYDYGAIDMVIDTDGKLQFLECNQMTNWDNATNSKVSPNALEQHKNMQNDLFSTDREVLKHKFILDN